MHLKYIRVLLYVHPSKIFLVSFSGNKIPHALIWFLVSLFVRLEISCGTNNQGLE